MQFPPKWVAMMRQAVVDDASGREEHDLRRGSQLAILSR